MVELQLEVVDRDFSIRVDGSVHSEAEDIFHGLIRVFDLKSSEERPFFFESLLEPQIGDFLGGGMDLLLIISIEFMVKNPLRLFDFGDILSDTGTDESILEPTIGPFHFALGLRREGIGDFHITILEDLFPLRGGLIGQEVVLIPERVSSPDKSEDGVRIDIIAVGEPILKDDSLEGQDMSPAGFLFNQNGIKEEAAIIIQGGDEIPFLLGRGCPEVMGGVMLDQFPSIMG